MLYVIGLGLSDEKDITVKGLEVGSWLASRGSYIQLLPLRAQVTWPQLCGRRTDIRR